MVISCRDRQRLQDDTVDFIKTWMKQNDVHLMGDEVAKILSVVQTRFINEYHALRKRRGKNERGEFL